MITYLTVISGISEFIHLLRSNWKAIFYVSWVVMFLYIVLWCIPKHRFSEPCGEARIDTIYLPADPTVYPMPVIRPTVTQMRQNPFTERFIPQAPSITADNATDSLRQCMDVLITQDRLLTRCDSLLQDATAYRETFDSTTNDSLTIFAKGYVRGELDSLELSYRDDRKPIMLKEVREKPVPQRSIFFGIGIGPEFLVENNRLESLRINAEAGYKAKNGHAVGVQGSYATSDRWFIGPKYVHHFQW